MNSKMEFKEQVVGRIFLKGEIKNVSPLAVSNGQTQFSDADIHRNDDGLPIIPGTAIMGVIKDKLSSLSDSSVYKYLFGFHDKFAKNDIQSHFIIDDLVCVSEEIVTNIRDGVKIKPETNLAENKGKYDYELLEPDHLFQFNAEITIRQHVDIDEVNGILSLIAYLLESEPLLQVGSLTSFGFGQLKANSICQTGLLEGKRYFEFLSDSSPTSFWHMVEPRRLESVTPIAVFEMNLKPTTPLFIGGGRVETEGADDASLKSRDNYILSAKSMKGAIRHHAYRIANTVHGAEVAAELCNKIFGNRDRKTLTKSKFWTTDAVIKNPGEVMPQYRVAIDRFTGGAIESALFATEPVWPTNSSTVEVRWRLNRIDETTNKAAIGLLLLVARDLMSEMLPIGGDKAIGRGRFRGSSFKYRIEDVVMSGSGLESNLSTIDAYIDSFLKFKIKA